MASTYTESTTLEGYYKNDNDNYVIVKLTDEVFKDGIRIASLLREVPIDEEKELGTIWDEDKLCEVVKAVRRDKETK